MVVGRCLEYFFVFFVIRNLNLLFIVRKVWWVNFFIVEGVKIIYYLVFDGRDGVDVV